MESRQKELCARVGAQQPDASTRVIDLRPDLFLLSDRLPLETICYDGAYKVRYELGTAICGNYKPSKGTALNVGSSPLKSQPFKSPGSSFVSLLFCFEKMMRMQAMLWFFCFVLLLRGKRFFVFVF